MKDLIIILLCILFLVTLFTDTVIIFLAVLGIVFLIWLWKIFVDILFK